MRILLVAALCVLSACTPSGSVVTPSASPSASLAASASPAAPTASATQATTLRPNPTAGPGTYTSVAFAYRVELPAGWRFSQCQSSADIVSPVFGGTEAFTSASTDDEAGSDMGPAHPVLYVRVVDNPGGRTALQWLSDGGLGFSSDAAFERATVDGREGARVVTQSGEVRALVTTARGRVYAIAAQGPDRVPPDAQRIMSSLHVLDDAELTTARASIATPAPTAARTVDTVADTLARGFAGKDTQPLATVAWSCLTRGLQNAGAGFRTATVVLAELRTSFAAGLTVVVTPGSVFVQPGDYGSVDASWTDPGKAPRPAKMTLMKRGDTWYWTGWILG